MSLPEKLTKGIQSFCDDVYPEHKGLFESLRDGQSPEVLLITCSDSRIVPSLVTQTLPGDLFIVRNAGNLVTTYGPHGTAEEAAIEYGVKALGVKHIVVCGHEKCGAMAALLQEGSTAELPAVEAWLKRAAPEGPVAPDASLSDQVAANVKRQLENLRTHPSVAEAEACGNLQLHGWVYDFVTGKLTVLDGDAVVGAASGS